MNIDWVTKLAQKRWRHQFRSIHKGYKVLRVENRLDFLVKIIDVLTKTPLNNVVLPKYLLLKNVTDVELSVRQYVSEKVILRVSFNKAMLYSIGVKKPLRYPLPQEWQDALFNQNVEVDRLSCTLLWHGYVLLIWGYSIVKTLKSLGYLLKKHKKLNRYIYFHNLKNNNLPLKVKSNTIINWYFQWENRAKGIDTICHSISDTSDTKYIKTDIEFTDGLPYLGSTQFLLYCVWFAGMSLYTLVIGLFNPYPAIMLNESIKLLRVSIATKDQLADDYLFHQELPYYRPLWTYEAEKKSSRILFYFYSTNTEPLKISKSILIPPAFHLMSWPHYLVWDKYQANFIRSVNSNNSIIEEVGLIWFSSSSKESLLIERSAITVFDITPKRKSNYITLGTSNEFYTSKVANQFLNDIQEVLAQNNYNMFHKKKRDVKDRKFKSCSKYDYNIKILETKPNYHKLDADLDALSVIEKSLATISMPFTSTAIIARFFDKPSVYYDPTGMIEKDNISAHEIPVLVNIDELKSWVQSIV